MKILVAVFAYNEGERIKETLRKHPQNRNYDLLVMNDGSTDGSVKKTPPNTKILSNFKNEGVGSAMKKVFLYALKNNYDVIVIQAGNNKDDAAEIPRLLKPIFDNEADFVQGSRFLNGGDYHNMPKLRILATKFIHPLLVSMAVGKKVTESTNGFRAFRVNILKNSNIYWRQKWLGKYELEPYLLYQTIKNGYKHLEVPVSKVYPKGWGYSKMTPLISWWSIVRPIIYLWLGIKK